jgi:hypothetical protein
MTNASCITKITLVVLFVFSTTGALAVEIMKDSVINQASLMVFNLNEKYGYVDKNLNVVIVPQFDKAYAFHEGLAAVEQNGKVVFIDKHGQIVIKHEPLSKV